MSNETIKNENDYVLNYVRLVPQDPSKTPEGQGYFDFSSHFVQFSYEESIFNHGIHGSMFVIDAVDYPTMLPMIGQERLKVSFTRPDEKQKEGGLLPPIEFDLPIYRIAGRRQDAGSRKRQTYTMFYGSDFVFKNINTRVFRKFSGMPYSEMVKKVYEEYLKIGDKKIEIEETEYQHEYFAQNISPLKCINNLAQRSISKTPGNGYFYVFYEDKDQFNYVTLAKLAAQKPAVTIKYQLKNMASGPDSLASKFNDLSESLYNTDTFQPQTGPDALGDALSGQGSSSLLSVDPIRRKFSLKAFDLRGEESKKIHGLDLVPNSDWEKFNHMEKGKPWKNDSKMFIDPRANMSMLISDSGQDTQEYIKARDPNVFPYNPEMFFLQRRSNKMQFLKHIVTTSLSGDPRIKVGIVIEFKVPEFMGKVNEESPEEYDKYMQGKYLVVGVAHVLKKNEYRMNLELIKDSVFSDIKSRDPVEEYKKIY